ncbi:MAG: hypothetical protein AB7S38_25705 [Vulcanimicrobiota bacterium]
MTLVRIPNHYLLLVVLDRRSPANDANLYQQAAPRGHRGLLDFFRGYVEAGQLQLLEFLWDGVYRVAAHQQDPPDELEHQGWLECPSGELLIGDISSLGQGLTRLVTVEPGCYRTGWLEDWAELEKHFWLDSPASYPAADGPDVTVCLSPR